MNTEMKHKPDCSKVTGEGHGSCNCRDTKINNTPTPGPKLWIDTCGCFQSTCGSYFCDDHLVKRNRELELAIKYLKIEHRKEKEGPHHDAECDLCEFIANAEAE